MRKSPRARKRRNKTLNREAAYLDILVGGFSHPKEQTKKKTITMPQNYCNTYFLTSCSEKSTV
jgi:hypothetical protein